LSPDGDEEIFKFSPDVIYVIGGLVDGRPIPNVTKFRAMHLGVKSARLPINKFRECNPFRCTLNLNSVFEIMDHYYVYGDIM
jgi:tRNA (Guanine-1)-methyltransferase